MTEVLRRRLKRLGQQNSQTNATDKKSDQSFATPPDLMIVDGGKGQLSAVHQILKQNNVSVPLVGMTKREEEIVLVRPSVNNKGEQASGDYVLHSRSARVRRSSAHGAIPWSAEDAKLQAKSEANFITIRLPRGSEALFIMQRIRDEAHRFAITYHRSLRSKGFLPGE